MLHVLYPGNASWSQMKTKIGVVSMELKKKLELGVNIIYEAVTVKIINNSVH